MRLILTAALVAVVAGPAAAATRSWPATGFDRIQLDAVADVTVRTGPSFSVRGDGPPDIVDRLSAEVRDGTLLIDWKVRTIRLRDGETPRFVVTMPRVAGAGLKGLGHITVDRAEAPLVVFAVEGTGSIEAGSIRADRTALSLRGVGSIAAGGTTRALDIRNAGTGSVDAGKLRASVATLTSTGMGSLDAHVDGPVTIVKSGMGSVSVTGAARCTVRKRGMGSVECGRG